jgi:4-aminobutyrate aminotransferase-like enzyme
MSQPVHSDAPRDAYQTMLGSPGFCQARDHFLKSIQEHTQSLRGLKPAAMTSVRDQYKAEISEFSRERGRDLYFQYLASGLGSGPYVELRDGSVKLDMITGIGIHFFGHAHPELMREMANAVGSDIMQGNLQPGVEAKEVISAILSRTGAEKGSKIKHAWLTCSGTMANEIALKIVRQKKSPATKIIAFEDCFAGRSTAMQEITDNPGYRQGQPIYGEVHYLPFYNPKMGLSRSLEITVGHLNWLASRYPGKFAALMMELVQGEGGFNSAPREFYIKTFEAAKAAGMAVWIDEVQTFGRTGELFAYQTFGLEPFVDVVTIGKMLQACMVLYTEEYNPKPGLVSGTFSGSTVALRTARRILEMLDEQKLLGPEGGIQKKSRHFKSKIQSMAEHECAGMIGEIRAVGGMIAFQPFEGTMDHVKKVLMKLFDLGVVAFYCGHGPYFVRMLPPLGVMTEAEIDETCRLISQALREVSPEIQTTHLTKA